MEGAMSRKATVELSEDAREYAENRAREEGMSTAGDYIETLIRDDYELVLGQEWLRRQIEDGLKSPDAGELTRARISELVEEGIARAKR
jgi:hypothetical protein